MQEILDLLVNSNLDATDLCISESDIEKIAYGINNFLNANIESFEIDKTENIRSLGSYVPSENMVYFFINSVRKHTNEILNRPFNKDIINKFSKEEYALLVKCLNMLVILHELDHVKQHQIMKNNEVNNSDYLLLELSHGNFIPFKNQILKEQVERKIGPLLYENLGRIECVNLTMNQERLFSTRGLIPYERMADFHAYEQLIRSLQLNNDEYINIISMIKLICLRPLFSYYTSFSNNNYDGTYSPSVYFITHTGGKAYYGDDFANNLLKVYHNHPLTYRFYTGLNLTLEEIKLYEDEIKESEHVLKKNK